MQPLPQYTVHRTLNIENSRTFLAQFDLVFTHFLDVKPQIMAQLMQQCPIEIGQCTWEWSAQPRYDRSTIQTFNALEGTHPRYDQGRMWRPYNTWACYKEWAAHPWYDLSLWKKILQSNPGHIHPSMYCNEDEIIGNIIIEWLILLFLFHGCEIEELQNKT